MHTCLWLMSSAGTGILLSTSAFTNCNLQLNAAIDNAVAPLLCREIRGPIERLEICKVGVPVRWKGYANAHFVYVFS